MIAAKKKICDVCGKEFEPKAANQKRCSGECSKKSRDTWRQEHYPRKLSNEKDKIGNCDVCGKEFVRTAFNGAKKRCFGECQRKAIEIARRRKILEEPKLNNQHERQLYFSKMNSMKVDLDFFFIRKCCICQVSFATAYCKKRTCSVECQELLLKKTDQQNCYRERAIGRRRLLGQENVLIQLTILVNKLEQATRGLRTNDHSNPEAA